MKSTFLHIIIRIFSSTGKQFMLFLMCCLFLFLVINEGTPAAFPSMNGERKRVLFINSYHTGEKWCDDIIQAVREQFAVNAPFAELYFEHLDTKHFPEKHHLQIFFDMLSVKYRSLPLDIVMTADNNALDFMLAHRSLFYPETSIVFCGVNFYTPEMLRGQKHITGVAEQADLKTTADIALKLHPKARKIIFIADSLSRTGRLNIEQVEHMRQKLEARVRIEVWNELTITEEEIKARQTESDAIFFIIGRPKNQKGELIESDEHGRRLSKASPAPVYSSWDFYMGTGVVGGFMINGTDHGNAAASLAIRILNGTPADAIPVITRTPASYMFDYHPLEKFGISLSQLPSGSIVMNQPFSFYETYKVIVWGVAVTLCMLTGLVMLLLVNVFHRRQAERALKKAHDDLEQRVIRRTHDLSQSNACLQAEIEERRKAEEQLRFQAMFLEQIKDSIVATDLEGKITYINEACARSVKRDREDLIGKSVHVFGENAAQGAAQDEIIHHTLTYGRWQGRVINYDVDGNEFVLETRTWKVYSSEGKTAGMIGISADVTAHVRAEAELKKAKQAAEAASQAKSEFLANMSHEIRTPLNAILGFSEILLKKSEDPRQQKFLTNIHTSGKILLSLISDILDLSKIEAGRVEIQMRLVSPKAIFEEIRSIFFQQCRDKGIRLKTEISPDLPEHLILDEIRIRQVLVNLVGNAVKFTDRGDITLRVFPISDFRLPIKNQKSKKPSFFKKLGFSGENQKSKIKNLQFEIEDTGIGISPDQQERIFEAFQQQTDQDIRKYGGTGLGLAISKKLVEMMNGSISVESEMDKGTIFRVILYDVEIEEEIELFEEPSEPDDIRVRFDPATILITDDVHSNRDLISGYLKDMDLSIIEAENGDHALAILRGDLRGFQNLGGLVMPDLILMDMRMPGRDGYEITRIIKGDDRLRHIPVIAFTASAMMEDEKKIRELFDGYLRKPVTWTALIRELKKFLSYEEIPGESVHPPVHSLASGNEDKESDVFVSAQAKARLPELVSLLENEMLAQWKDIKEVFFIDDVVDFAEKLKQVALGYDMAMLSDYSQKLYESAQESHLDDIETFLAEFPHIIDKIRNI